MSLLESLKIPWLRLVPAFASVSASLFKLLRMWKALNCVNVLAIRTKIFQSCDLPWRIEYLLEGPQQYFWDLWELDS